MLWGAGHLEHVREDLSTVIDKVSPALVGERSGNNDASTTCSTGSSGCVMVKSLDKIFIIFDPTPFFKEKVLDARVFFFFFER